MKRVFVLLIAAVVFSSFALAVSYADGMSMESFADGLHSLTDEDLLAYDSLIEREKAERFSKSISMLSDEDLLAYEAIIESEKAGRGMNVVLPNGEYLVGRDIAAGHYYVRLYIWDRYYTIRIYENEDKNDYIYDESGQYSARVRLNLEEGQVLYVDVDSGLTVIEKTAGLFMDDGQE